MRRHVWRCERSMHRTGQDQIRQVNHRASDAITPAMPSSEGIFTRCLYIRIMEKCTRLYSISSARMSFVAHRPNCHVNIEVFAACPRVVPGVVHSLWG